MTVTLTRNELIVLLKAGRVITPAMLYEKENATDGSEFVYIQITQSLTRYYRIWPEGTAKDKRALKLQP